MLTFVDQVDLINHLNSQGTPKFWGNEKFQSWEIPPNLEKLAIFSLAFGRERLFSLRCNNSWAGFSMKRLSYYYQTLEKEINEENLFLLTKFP